MSPLNVQLKTKVRVRAASELLERFDQGREVGHTPGQALELENGQTCTPLTGATAPIAGMRINYSCGDDAYVAGPVDRSRPLWRVFYQTPNRSLSLQQVTVTTAWY